MNGKRAPLPKATPNISLPKQPRSPVCALRLCAKLFVTEKCTGGFGVILSPEQGSPCSGCETSRDTHCIIIS